MFRYLSVVAQALGETGHCEHRLLSRLDGPAGFRGLFGWLSWPLFSRYSCSGVSTQSSAELLKHGPCVADSRGPSNRSASSNFGDL